MAAKSKVEAQNPLIIRCHRLMDAFAKSNDERDFYLDRQEGYILYIDLDKSDTEIENIEKELHQNNDRYVLIPKLTFYETKKLMEGFVNEKVYDIDTKEKLLDIIQSKEARENFLEFVFDHHSEYEKWQQFYQERSRIRIIEWLRQNNIYFVFEEDLDLSSKLLEGLKRQLFQSKVSKDITTARKTLIAKAKTYYSNEALNPRPKRGRPPKQAVKTEVEPQITSDIYTTVTPAGLPFLFTPDITAASAVTFSAKFESEEDLAAHKKHTKNEGEISIESFNEKLASLRSLSTKWLPQQPSLAKAPPKFQPDDDFDEEEDEEQDWDDVDYAKKKKTPPPKAPTPPKAPPAPKVVAPKKVEAKAKPVAPPPKKPEPVKVAPKPAKKPPVSKAPIKKAPVKNIPAKKPLVKKPPVKVAAKKPVLKKPAPKPVMKKLPVKQAPAKKAVPPKKPVKRR